MCSDSENPIEERKKQEQIAQQIEYLISNQEYILNAMTDSQLTDLASDIGCEKELRIENRKKDGIIKCDDGIRQEIIRISCRELYYEYVDDCAPDIYLNTDDDTCRFSEKEALIILRTIPTDATIEEIESILYEAQWDD